MSNLGEVAKQVVSADPAKVEAEIRSMKYELDLNKDGKISFKEFSVGLLSSPRLIMIVVSLLAGFYGMYHVILGMVGEGWNTMALVFSFSMVSSVAVLYVIIKRLNDSEIETINKITETDDDAYQRIKQLAEKYLDQAIKNEDELRAVKTVLGMYKWAWDVVKKQNPTITMPDITEPDPI